MRQIKNMEGEKNMGYQVKKIIEFDPIYKKTVSILKGAILEKDNGEQVLQLKLYNSGDDILNKVTAKIICYGLDKNVLGVQTYTYENLFVKSGETFGTDVPIPLLYDGTETISVEILNNYEKLQVYSSKFENSGPNISSMICNIVVSIASIVGMLIAFILTVGAFNAGVKGQLLWLTLVGILVIKRTTILIKFQIIYMKLTEFFGNM